MASNRKRTAPAESEATTAPAESEATTAPAESEATTTAESEATAPAPTVEPAEWDALAAFTPDGAGWPTILPDDVIPAVLAGVTLHLQSVGGANGRNAAMYSTGGRSVGMYGTADRAQTDADARHAAGGQDGKGHAPAPRHVIAIVGGGPVIGPDGALSGRYSPRKSDRPGTLRLMRECAACSGGRAIL